MRTIERTRPDSLAEFFRTQSLDCATGVVAAFSGGADSLAMLWLLSHVVPQDRLVAVYADHALRSQAELSAERELNQANCNRIGVPLRIMELGSEAVARCARERGHGIEDAARHLRYKVLETVRQKLQFAYIATAHTADDQMETVLMRLFQGSGATGLRGIAEANLPIIRPVLRWTKAELVEVLRDEGLAWSEDSTNAGGDYTRNLIRQRLIPVVGEVFPGYRSALAALIEKSEVLDGYIEEQTQLQAEGVATLAPSGILIDAIRFNSLSRPIRERVLYDAWGLLASSKGEPLTYRSVRHALKFMESGPKERAMAFLQGSSLTYQGEAFLWQGGRLPLAVGYVSLVYSKETPLYDSWLLVGSEVHPEDGHDGLAAVLDERMLALPIIARSFRAGDTIVLKEGTKSVASLLAEWDISVTERVLVPVLEDRMGVFAVLGRTFGGKDRVARRCLLPTLVGKRRTLYSVLEYKD